ncbi:MAG: nucleoside phosphorylase [Deltaproteobacteria bacterium]|nr:nucleoside phosphorylase [Deltaproteobacteria bacterium]
MIRFIDDFYSSDMDILVDPKKMMNSLNPKGLTPLEEKAIITFLPGDFKFLSKLCNGEKIERWEGIRPIFKGKVDGEKIIIARSGVGAPASVMLLEEMFAFGVRKVLFFGYCGGIALGINSGDFLLPEEAVREEGTSYHYQPKGIPAKGDKEFIDILEKIIKQEGHPYHKGIVWTTDAIYRETMRKVRRFREEGILGVEMETSALFASAAFRGIKIAGLLVVSDIFTKRIWKPAFFSSAFRNASKLGLKILVEAIPFI